MEKIISESLPVVGVDFDDVIRDFVPTFLEYYYHRTNQRFTKDEFHTYNFWETLRCTKEESKQIIIDFYDSPFFDAIQPCSGAISALRALATFAHPRIVTAAAYKTKKQGERFLRDYAPGLVVPVIYAASAYFPVNEKNKRSKSEILRDIGAKAMVEDNSDFALACANHGVPVYLVRQPWNRTMPDHPAITRVDSLEHAVDKLRQQPLKTAPCSPAHGCAH
jgi:hypothetical protein